MRTNTFERSHTIFERSHNILERSHNILERSHTIFERSHDILLKAEILNFGSRQDFPDLKELFVQPFDHIRDHIFFHDKRKIHRRSPVRNEGDVNIFDGREYL